jgi:hypothetical protein
MKRIGRVMFAAAIGIGMLASAAPTFASSGGFHQGSTIVTLDNGTLTTIVGLGIMPSAVKPGVIDADPGVVTATFPITEIEKGVIQHAGGIKLTKGTTKLSLTSYYIQGATLTARASLNGMFLGRIPLFDLTNVMSFKSRHCAVTADLRFTSAAAGALTAVFKAPDVTGVLFGSACVAPKSHDEDRD